MEKINNELSKELNKNNSHEKGIFFDKFKDHNINNRFYDYLNENYFYFSIFIQVILTYVFVYSAVMFSDTILKIVVLAFVIVEVVLFIIISISPSLDKKYMLSIVKYFILLLNSITLLMSISINVIKSNNSIFVFTFLALLGIVCISLNFTIKKYSFFTNLITFLGFLSMVLVNILTNYELNFVNIENLNSISTELSCSSLKSYIFNGIKEFSIEEDINNVFAFHIIKVITTKDGKLKDMSKKEIQKFDEYISLRNKLQNYTKFSEEIKSIDNKLTFYDDIFNENITMDEFTYLYYLRLVSNMTISNILKKNLTAHAPFPIYLRLLRNNDFDFANMKNYFLKDNVMQKTKSYGLNHQLCNCLSFIFSKDQGLRETSSVLIEKGNFFISKNKRLSTKLSIISTCLFFILFLMFNYFFHNSHKESFSSNLKYKVMSEYYENFIKGMKSKVISLNLDKILFINKVMYDFLSFDNSSGKCFDKKINENKEELLKSNKVKDETELETDNVINEKDIFERNKLFMQRSKKYNHSSDNSNDNNSLFDEFINLLSTKEQTDEFDNLGQFCNNENGLKFYNVFYRYVKNDNLNFIDFVFHDITEIIIAQAQITASKEKEKVMSKVAHEFKTPLIIIKNSVNELRNEMTKKESKQIIDKIINISDYVSFLINDIINESNKNTLKIEKSKINIIEILDFCYNIAKSLASSIGSPNVKINLVCDEVIKKLIVITDPIRLKQVFLNLLSNSIKFTKYGTICIAAEAVKQKDDNFNLVIKIVDTGVGIRPNDLISLQNVLSNKSDDPLVFKQNNNTNSMGTGLGIGICKLIIDKLEYSIDVKSKYGEGTQFIITITNTFTHNSSKFLTSDLNVNLASKKSSSFRNMELVENPPESMKNYEILDDTHKFENSLNFNYFDKNELRNFPTIKKKEHEKIEDNISAEYFNDDENHDSINNNNHDINNVNNDNEVNNANPNKNIILVVDDCNEIKKSIINLLKGDSKLSNYEILTANDGSEMIHLISQDQFNGNRIKLVLSDEEMNFLNGSEALKIIKKMESEYKVKPIKYVSLTSHDSSHYNRLYQIGFNEIISKPLRKDNLKILIQLLKV